MQEHAALTSTNLASSRAPLAMTREASAMYRIELKPGEENVFRTIEELATAIRNGLVTPRARIFHNASQKWFPVEFHPHYKKALSLPPTKSGETPAVGVQSRKSGEAPAIPAPP